MKIVNILLLISLIESKIFHILFQLLNKSSTIIIFSELIFHSMIFHNHVVFLSFLTINQLISFPLFIHSNIIHHIKGTAPSSKPPI
ncbi:hypothetical protein HOF65_04465 [bacterium]|nr:hypothetical protein [bacterium]MBT4633161.1 hypothetical protein [bacterium]MBT6778678.1 hypothetical protein [bacterium]